MNVAAIDSPTVRSVLSSPLGSVLAWTAVAMIGLAAPALASCGGSSKPTPAGPATEASETSEDTGDTVVSADTMDEIRRALDRKRNVVARCLAPAIDAGELPSNARGKITLSFVISKAGKAEDLKVIKASLTSPIVTECVIKRIAEIEFPTLPDPLPWSYTYGFEAM